MVGAVFFPDLDSVVDLVLLKVNALYLCLYLVARDAAETSARPIDELCLEVRFTHVFA